MQREAKDDAGQADDRAHREVDAAGQDDEGHADRDDADHDRLVEQVETDCCWSGNTARAGTDPAPGCSASASMRSSSGAEAAQPARGGSNARGSAVRTASGAWRHVWLAKKR